MRHSEEGWEFFEVHLPSATGLVALVYTVPEALHETDLGSVFHRVTAVGLNGLGARNPVLQLISQTGLLMATYPSPGTVNAPQVLETTWGVADASLFTPLTLDLRIAVMSFGALIRPGDRFRLLLDNGVAADSHSAQIRYRGR